VVPLDVVDPVLPWLVAGPPLFPPPTGFAKWPPPLVWLAPGAPEPPVVGADGVLGCVATGVLGAVVAELELLDDGVVGAGWLPVPNVLVPM
jgi:hypothetical protein